MKNKYEAPEIQAIIFGSDMCTDNELDFVAGIDVVLASQGGEKDSNMLNYNCGVEPFL